MDDTRLKPEYEKKINQARASMIAFDQLPQPIKEALKSSKTDFSAEQMLELYHQGWPVDRLLMAIDAQQPPDR